MFLEPSLPIEKSDLQWLLALQSPDLAPLRQGVWEKEGCVLLPGEKAAAGPHFLCLAYSAILGELFLFNVSRANPSTAKSEKITC